VLTTRSTAVEVDQIPRARARLRDAPPAAARRGSMARGDEARRRRIGFLWSFGDPFSELRARARARSPNANRRRDQTASSILVVSSVTEEVLAVPRARRGLDHQVAEGPG